MSQIEKYMRGQIIKLVWPVILEGFGIMLLGVLITAMVGQFGAVSLSAVGLATLMHMSCSVVFSAAGTGAGVIVARHTGAGNWEQARLVTGQAISIGLLLGVILAIGGYWLSPAAVALTGAGPEVVHLAGGLLEVVFIFTPFYLVMSISNSILRVMGQTRLVFYMTTANIILALMTSYLLIFVGLGGLPMEAYGAAWGLAFSQLSGGLIALAVLIYHPQIRLRWKDVCQCRAELVTAIIRISSPVALEQLALQGGRLVFTFMLAGAGVVQFAGHQIAVQVESISFIPGFGFCIAAMALTGQCLGKGMPHRAAQYVGLTNTLAVVGMALMSLFFLLFAEQLVGLFIADPAVIYWGKWCVILAALEQPMIAMTYVYSGALRGAGDTKWPFYITTLGVWGFRLPLIYLFIVVWQYDIPWAWGITAVDYSVRAVIFRRRFHANKWQHIQVG